MPCRNHWAKEVTSCPVHFCLLSNSTCPATPLCMTAKQDRYQSCLQTVLKGIWLVVRSSLFLFLWNLASKGPPMFLHLPRLLLVSFCLNNVLLLWPFQPRIMHRILVQLQPITKIKKGLQYFYILLFPKNRAIQLFI